MNFSVQQYRNENGRYRWAVLHGPTRTWHFPSQYGKKAAQALANRLNKEIKEWK